MSHRQRTLLLAFGGDAVNELVERIIQYIGDSSLICYLSDHQLASPEAREDVLKRALWEISDMQRHRQLGSQGLPPRSEDDIVVWVLLNATTAWDADPQVVVEALQQTAWSQLRSAIQVAALIWSYPGLHEATRHAIAAVASLAPPVQAIFLASPVTQGGLVMEEGAVIEELAQIMVAMLTSSLAAILPTFPQIQASTNNPFQNPSSPAFGEVEWMTWPDNEGIGAVPMLGVGAARYENPMPAIREQLAQQWVWEVSQRLFQVFQDRAMPEQDESFRYEEPLMTWHPRRLFESVLAALRASLQWSEEERKDAPAWHRLASLTEELHHVMDRQQQNLDAQANVAMKEIIEPAQKKWQQYLTEEEATALQPASGAWSLAPYRMRLQQNYTQWVRWADIEQQRMDDLAEKQTSIDERLAEMESQIDGTLRHLHIRTIRELLSLFVHPLRTLSLVRAYLKIPQLLRKHAQARDAWLQLQSNKLASQLVRQYCLAAAQDITAAQQRLQTLTTTIVTLSQQTSPPSIDASLFPAEALQRLRSMLFFDEELPLKRFLEKHPMTEWIGRNAEGILDDLKGFARMWLGPLTQWTTSDALAFIFNEDKTALGRWVQHFLDQPPIFWPHHQPDPSHILALMLPGDENDLLWRIAVRQERIQWLVRGARSAPILAIRFQPFLSVQEIEGAPYDLPEASFTSHG